MELRFSHHCGRAFVNLTRLLTEKKVPTMGLSALRVVNGVARMATKEPWSVSAISILLIGRIACVGWSGKLQVTKESMHMISTLNLEK